MNGETNTINDAQQHDHLQEGAHVQEGAQVRHGDQVQHGGQVRQATQVQQNGQDDSVTNLSELFLPEDEAHVASRSMLQGGLRDISGMDEPSSWPPAPIWWLVAAIIIALIFLLVCRQLRKMTYLRSWQYDAMCELDNLAATLREDNKHESLIALAVLIKRIIIHKYSREECAALSGNKLLDWLAEHDPAAFDWRTKGTYLVNAIYAPKAYATKTGSFSVNVDLKVITEIVEAMRKWVDKEQLLARGRGVDVREQGVSRSGWLGAKGQGVTREQGVAREQSVAEKNSVTAEQYGKKLHNSATDQKGGNQKLGDQKGGNQKLGDQKGSNQKLGDQKGSNQKLGDQKGGNQKLGDQKGGNQKLGDQKGGNQKLGDQKGGDQKLGDQNGGNEKEISGKGGKYV